MAQQAAGLMQVESNRIKWHEDTSETYHRIIAA
jgi:hypothetical protein